MQPESLVPHPLREWRVRNFKSVVGETVQMAPLTILVGANSSGKSSLLQSILLLVQSARALRPDDAIPLNEELVRLGRLEDLRSVQAGEDDVEVGGVMDVASLATPLAAAQAVSWSVALNGTPEGRPSAACVSSSMLEVASDDTEAKLVVRRTAIDDSDGSTLADSTALLGRAITGFTWFKGEVACPDSDDTLIEGATLHGGVVTQPLIAASETGVFAARWWRRHRLGRRSMQASVGDVEAIHERIAALKRRLSSPLVAETRGHIQRQLAGLQEELARIERASDFQSLDADEKLDLVVDEARKLLARLRDESATTLTSPGATSRIAATLIGDPDVTGRYEDFLERIEAAEGPGRRVLVPAEAEWASLLTDAGRQLRTFMSERVHYLGPLRQDPHDGGFVTGTAGDVGTRGEHGAATFFAESRRILEFPMPDGGVSRCSLGEAFTAWVDYLGLAGAVRAEDLGRSGVEMRVRPLSLDREVDLTAVGVGVSQVLPVLLVCLLAEPPSLVLLEQPELHLHPAVQQRLADFFIACAESGRQVVLETHSEYLISRLRLRVAEDLTDSRRHLLQLLFAEIADGRTNFRSVGITELGGLDEWPAGFFDQMPGEAQQILAAALRKRQQMQEGGAAAEPGSTGDGTARP